MESSYQPYMFQERPPGLEGVVEGTYQINHPEERSWPKEPPGVIAKPTAVAGTVDEEDVLLGKREKRLQNIDVDVQHDVILENQYNELYEAPNMSSFEEIGLADDIVKALYVEMKFDKPSKIQAMTLPTICKEPYPSLVAQAQNGCGKTCCFALCILSRLEIGNFEGPQGMVVVPTRELAIQNSSVIRQMGKFIGARVLSTSETDRLHRDALYHPTDSLITEHVIVGTHGSLRIFRRKGWLSFRCMKVVVLDEADHMIEREGFRDDTSKMIQHVDADAEAAGLQRPQLLMFSATYRADIRDFANKLFELGMREAHKMWIPKEELSLDKIKQAKVKCWSYLDKISVVSDFILPSCCEKMGKTIIFVRYRETAAELHDCLRGHHILRVLIVMLGKGWPVTSISGAMDYSDRDRVIAEFRNNVTNTLIATDILSRGFDVSDVTLVINFDVPRALGSYDPAYETYLHRVGRTGRFKRRGVAFNLLSMTNTEGDWYMKQIEEYFERTIPFLDVKNEVEMRNFLKEAGLVDMDVH